MRRTSVKGVAVAMTLALAATTAMGQAQILATYAFGASQAVAGDGALIIMGAGGGIFLLDGQHDQPTLYEPYQGFVNNELRTLGFTREIFPTDDDLYVAAGRAGLVRYDRSTYDEDWRVLFDIQDDTNTDDPEVWTVDVTHLGGADSDIVFVGTHDHGDGSGTLLLLHAPLEDDPTIVESIDLAAPIYSMASMVKDDWLTLLVGTACRSGGALLRYDWDLTAGLPATFPTPVTWSADDGGGALPTFVRDIVIDADADIAFVAASSRGLFKFDIHGGALDEMAYSVLPATGTNVNLFSGLALRDDLLVAAVGPQLWVERQVWDSCSELSPCDDGEGTAQMSVRLYSTANGLDQLPLDSVTLDEGQPLKVSVRDVDADEFRIDVAADGGGLQVLVAESTGGNWTLESRGSWSKAEGFPTTSTDDVILVGNSLYAAYETGIAAFRGNYDPSVPAELAELLKAPMVPYTHGAGAAVLVTGFQASPDRAVIFGRGYPGTAFFNADLNWGLATQITYDGLLDSRFTQKGFGAFVLEDTPDPEGWPWLFIVYAADEASRVSLCDDPPNQIHGSVHVFRIQDSDEDSLYEADEAVEIGSWVPQVCKGGLLSTEPDADGYFLGCHVEPTGGTDEFAVWVSYGPRHTEEGAGVMVLKATWNEALDSVEFEFEGKVEATSAPCGAFTGRLAYPIGTDNKLAVTLACGGVAVYDVTDKLAPDLDGNWPAAADCNDGLSALHVAEGPGNHMYVTFINMDVGGIGVFDVDDVESGPIVGTHTTPEGMYTTPFNAQALIPAPSSLPNGEPAFFVADGRGGLHYIQFPTVSP